MSPMFYSINAVTLEVKFKWMNNLSGVLERGTVCLLQI